MKRPGRAMGLFLAAYYATNAVYQGYLSKYFQSAGMEGTQLTLLLAAGPLISMLTQPFWGARGDRAKRRDRLLRLLIGCALPLALCFLLPGGFPLMMCVSCLFAGFFTAIQPMGDSVILEALEKSGERFGPLRLMGCWAFALVNLAVGFLFGDRYGLQPVFTSAALLLLFLSSFTLPPSPGRQREKGRAPLKKLLAIPDFLPLMIMTMLLQLAMGYFYSYYPIYFTALPGATSGLLGLSYFLSAMSETPFLIFSDRLFDRFGAGKMMLVSALCMTARFTLLALTKSVSVALASQLFHGGGFIVITVCMSKHIARQAPEELRTRGQMILAVVGFGLARVFGVLGGGLISQSLGGARGGFVLMAGISAATLTLFSFKFLPRRLQNGSQDVSA